MVDTVKGNVMTEKMEEVGEGHGQRDGGADGLVLLEETWGLDECVWCMMGASPIRHPITGTGLNGLTNHGLPSFLPISYKPQNNTSIFHSRENHRQCVCWHLCINACVCVKECVCMCLWRFSSTYVYLTYPYMWYCRSGSESHLRLYYCWRGKWEKRWTGKT